MHIDTDLHPSTYVYVTIHTYVESVLMIYRHFC